MATTPDSQPSRGADLEYCIEWPSQGHSWVWVHHAARADPRDPTVQLSAVYTRYCSGCRYTDVSEAQGVIAALRQQLEQVWGQATTRIPHAQLFEKTPAEIYELGMRYGQAVEAQERYRRWLQAAETTPEPDERERLLTRLESAARVKIGEVIRQWARDEIRLQSSWIWHELGESKLEQIAEKIATVFERRATTRKETR